MSLRAFIREYRKEIDAVILDAVPNAGRIDNRERELWVMHDYGLWSWAKAEGVEV